MYVYIQFHLYYMIIFVTQSTVSWVFLKTISSKTLYRTLHSIAADGLYILYLYISIENRRILTIGKV